MVINMRGMSDMFDNIGGKIKGLAVTICVIGIMASVIGAIGLWAMNNYRNPTVALGIVVLVGGCLLSWIGSFFMYGFGQMIEDIAAIRVALQNNDEGRQTPDERVQRPMVSVGTDEKEPHKVAWRCSKCVGFNGSDAVKCQFCGKLKE